MDENDLDALFQRSIQQIQDDEFALPGSAPAEPSRPAAKSRAPKSSRPRREDFGALQSGELPHQTHKGKRKADTAGSGWYDMPAFAPDGSDKWTTTRGPTGDDLRREVQAIRLRNSLDPKRFYRGGERGMPKYAQLGRIISSSSEPAATIARADRGKTVIEELVRDAEASAYAKRKFGEEQSRREAKWSSHVKRGHKKRQRR